MEISEEEGIPDTLPEASMGPRLFRRGNDNMAEPSDNFVPASMGPRLFRRGNRAERGGKDG